MKCRRSTKTYQVIPTAKSWLSSSVLKPGRLPRTLHDQPADQRKSRLFNAFNDFKRESLAIEAGFSLPTTQAILLLDQLLGSVKMGELAISPWINLLVIGELYYIGRSIKNEQSKCVLLFIK
jgi:hypothetical protein